MSLRYALSALAFVAVLSGSATATPCPAGCGQQKKSCLQVGRVAKLACKEDCRSNVDPGGRGACSRACTDVFRAAKTVCQSDLRACLDNCHPTSPPGPPPPNSCLGNCGQDLGECARGVTAAARSCVMACGSGAGRLACLQDCAATAQQGGDACAAAFEACRTACPSSPSSAFLE